MVTRSVTPHQEIIEQAKRFELPGIDSKDALHISCAVAARAQYFITVDKGIIKHRNRVTEVHIRSPLEFVEQEG
ncbi:MAG: hypothetical protein EA403_01190 [Spirochaetaceae bacterium]|nr:MAG: hypothetical protein EA403_01190 [Spirochaetaceae bacterium]